MKINRKKWLAELEAVAPGLDLRGMVEEQSTCFVFRDGRVITYNNEVACSAASSLAGVDGAVQADPLMKLLRKLKEDEVDVSVGDGKLLVKGKGRRAGVTMEADVTLPVESIDEPERWRKLPEGFVEAVDVVRRCAGTDESRFVLTCVHVCPEWVEATDDFQIIRYPIKTGFKWTKTEEDGVFQGVLVRRESLRHLAAAGVTEFGLTEDWLHFRNPDGLTLSCRRYPGKYPRLDDALDVDGVAVTLPEGLAEAVEKAGIFSGDDEAGDQVSVELRDGRLRLEGHGTSGWYEERRRIEYEGKPVKFRIEPELLIEIVRRADVWRVAEGRLRVDGGKFTYVSCTDIVGDDE